MIEHQVGEEESIADIAVRYLEADRGGEPHFYAAAGPLSDEWCFLARAERLDELQIAARAILEQENTRRIFIACAALMGVEWQPGAMVMLLEAQDRNGRGLMRRAPETVDADVEDLRRIRREAAAEISEDN